MAGGGGDTDSGLKQLYVQAEAARGRSQALAAQHRAVQRRTAEILQSIGAAQDRAQQVHNMWLARGSGTMRYSAYARLRAQLVSMPVIEQAKGILMAQFGWPEEQAFDALRRTSQRENIKLRDLAAKIVAKTAQSASAQPRARERQQRSETAGVGRAPEMPPPSPQLPAASASPEPSSILMSTSKVRRGARS